MSEEDEKDIRWWQDGTVWAVAVLTVCAIAFVAFLGTMAWNTVSAEQYAADRLRAVVEEQNATYLEDGAYRSSADTVVSVLASDDGWAALADSGTGRFFMSASTAPEPVEVRVGSLYTFDVSGGPTLPAGVSMWGLVSGLLEAQGRGGFYTKFVLPGDAPTQTVFEMDPDMPGPYIESVEWEIAGLQRACATVTVASAAGNVPWRVRVSGASDDGFRKVYAHRESVEFHIEEGYGFVEDWYSIKNRGYMRNIVGVLTSTSTVTPEGRDFRVCATGMPYDFPAETGEAVQVDGGWELRASSPFPRVLTADVPETGEFSPQCLTEWRFSGGTRLTSCSNRPVAAGAPFRVMVDSADGR